MRTCRLELSLVRKPAWAERRCFLGLCSWFLHISPHLNAGISTASSLGEKKTKTTKNLQFRDLSLFRLPPTYQLETCVHWEWWICFETSVEDSVCLQNPFWTFPTETPPACLFFSWRGKRVEGRNLGSQVPFCSCFSIHQKPQPMGAVTFKDVGRIWAERLKVSKAEKPCVTGNGKTWFSITLVS